MKLKDIRTDYLICDIIVWACYPIYNKFGIILYPYRKYRESLQKQYADYYRRRKSLLSY